MKTAMHWLEQELRKLAFDDIHHLGMGDIMVTQGMLDDLFNKGKEMEKEQIVNAYKEGCFDGGFFDEKWDEVRAKEYYNETYNPDQV